MTVCKNLIDSAQAIVLAMRKIGIDCETPSNRVSRVSFILFPFFYARFFGHCIYLPGSLFWQFPNVPPLSLTHFRA
jgi:hypothetical protein